MVKEMAIAAVMVGLVVAGLAAQQHQPPAGQKPDHMQHAFDDPDKYAKQFDDPARDAWQMPDRVVAALGLKAGQSVADIGAGTDSPNLPTPVDTILVVDTYHHIANRVEYFRKLRASLKPGGQLAIVDFRKDSPDGPPVEFRFTAEEISAELAKAGYRLATSHAFLPRQLFLVYSLQ